MYKKILKFIAFVVSFVILSPTVSAMANSRTIYNYTDLPFAIQWTPDSQNYTETGCVTFAGIPDPCLDHVITSGVIFPAVTKSAKGVLGSPSTLSINYIAMHWAVLKYGIYGWMGFPNINGVGWGVFNDEAGSNGFNIYLKGDWFDRSIINKDNVVEAIRFVNNKSGNNGRTYYGDITICYPNQPPC